MQYEHADVTDRVLCSFYNVYNRLGHGFLEKVYENALAYELAKQGVSCGQQVPLNVKYDDKIVGEYFCDLIVEDKVILEIKVATTLRPEHEAQLLNYLKATGIKVGLLLNFGAKPQVKRMVF